MKTIILILILFWTTSCYGFNMDDVTYPHYEPPGSLRIKYTGVRGVIIDETIDLLSDQWRSDDFQRFNCGDITIEQFRSSLELLNNVVEDGRYNGVWWSRRWTESLITKHGGAPRTRSIKIGRTGDVIDLGIARINENFKFKMKEYSVNFSERWKFKVRPRLLFNTNDWVSRASVELFLRYAIKGVRRFGISLETGYSVRLREFIWIRIELLRT